MPIDPETVPPLTDAEVARFRAMIHLSLVSWHDLHEDQRTNYRKAFNAAYALAASRVDTAEVERRAAREAWDAALTLHMHRDSYLAREYPAARECVKCELCGGPMEDARYANHAELDTCVRFLVAEVKRLAAEVGP